MSGLREKTKAKMTLRFHAWVTRWLEISQAQIWSMDESERERDLGREDDELSFRHLGRIRMADFQDISICAEKRKKERKKNGCSTYKKFRVRKDTVWSRTLGKVCTEKI